MPVGQGSLLFGLARGFHSLLNAGEVQRTPQLIAVQSKACAPIWKEYSTGKFRPSAICEEKTIAEGIRILNPLRAKGVISAIQRSRGDVIAVEEGEILEGWKELGGRGLYVEPTSAVVWPALLKLWDQLQDPIVVILTGTGLKSLDL
jgi:threonine synthase